LKWIEHWKVKWKLENELQIWWKKTKKNWQKKRKKRKMKTDYIKEGLKWLKENVSCPCGSQFHKMKQNRHEQKVKTTCWFLQTQTNHNRLQAFNQYIFDYIYINIYINISIPFIHSNCLMTLY